MRNAAAPVVKMFMDACADVKRSVVCNAGNNIHAILDEKSTLRINDLLSESLRWKIMSLIILQRWWHFISSHILQLWMLHSCFQWGQDVVLSSGRQTCDDKKCWDEAHIIIQLMMLLVLGIMVRSEQSLAIQLLSIIMQRWGHSLLLECFRL